MPRVRVLLLGHPLVEDDGSPLQIDTRKAVALLAYLLTRERPQSRDTLASLLWPEYDETSARAALRRTLSTLRSSIGADAVVADRQTIAIRRELLDIDIDHVRRALDTVRRHGHHPRDACSACLPDLLDAAAVARGDFLEGFSLRDAPEFDDWQVAEAESMRRLLAHVLEGATAGSAQKGESDEAISLAKRWLALDPLHEPAHRALMRLYMGAGQRAAALSQYRECVRILQTELAVTPAEETTELYKSLREREDASAAPPPAGPKYEPPARRLPLTGRERELERLAVACDAMFRQGYVVALEGEAGIGKTRLMSELLSRARERGATVVAARCYEGETDLPYAPIAHLLRSTLSAGIHPDPADMKEVARLLPDVGQDADDAAVDPVASPGAHTRFLEGVVRVLLAPSEKRPLLLAIDDLQWADASSLTCVLYLLHRLGDRPVGIVLAWRSQDLPAAHVVRRAVLDLERRGAGELMLLGRLDLQSVRALVEAVAPQESSADLGLQLFAETEGLPLFLDEYLALLRRGSHPDTLPRGVREMLESRLALVSDVGRQFLAVAAVIGRSFEFDTLREASGRDEEMVIAALEELTGQELVRMTSSADGMDAVYDFSHDKLRAVVYDDASLPRRRLLHRRVAETLAERTRRTGDNAMAAAVAHHYGAAGLTRESAHYYAVAGAHARTLYANREALSHFESALALGHDDPRDIHEALGDVHALLGEYRAAVDRYESAAALTEGAHLAVIDQKLGNVYDRWGEWDMADAHYEAALQALEDADVTGRARIFADRAMAVHHRGDEAAARSLAGTALSLADEARDPVALARVHNILGILAAGEGQFVDAACHLEQSFRHAEDLEDPTTRIAALHNLALVEWRRGNPRAALTLAEDALARSVAQGDRHREAALHNTIADLLHAGGAAGESMAHLKRAVSIYSEIGVDAGAVRPEVWKLSEW